MHRNLTKFVLSLEHLVLKSTLLDLFLWNRYNQNKLAFTSDLSKKLYNTKHKLHDFAQSIIQGDKDSLKSIHLVL
ncbi:hypothetical protein SAMN05216480_107105 [Pustulibacterium marinum]|uniref:Uncharacterized protein n=1 Tax=Pustulibacterium marinum TaxID=1224947 RepID=A0A1I7H610_9FLAO|nr:hypothetical protein SAMN05216480_107105 [Pustulibacterium marinum]